MPPRYAFWTILIDNKPTAFRARDKEELLPTLAQLRRTSSDVVIKWFARGRVWDTPEQAQWAGRNLQGAREKRPRDWRPGGEHKDPRARFDKRKDGRRPSGVGVTSERYGAKASAGGAPREERGTEHKDHPRARLDKRRGGRGPAGETPDRPGAKPTVSGVGAPRPPKTDQQEGARAGVDKRTKPQHRATGRHREDAERVSNPARKSAVAQRFDDRRASKDRPVRDTGRRGPKGQPQWRDKRSPGKKQRPWHGGREERRSLEPKKPDRAGFKKFPPRSDRSVDVPPEPREVEPPRRSRESPEAPPAPEQIVIKPEPPERG